MENNDDCNASRGGSRGGLDSKKENNVGVTLLSKTWRSVGFVTAYGFDYAR